MVEEVIREPILDAYLGPVRQPVDDPLAALQGALRRRADDVHEIGIRFGCPLNNLTQEMAPLDEGFRTRVAATLGEWTGGIAEAPEAGPYPFGRALRLRIETHLFGWRILMRGWFTAALAAILMAPAVAGAQGGTGAATVALLSRAEEVALAESAAPPDVSSEAAVYVLERQGYVLARPGQNGFTCLVERSHPRSLEPICYDAEGTATVLPVVLDAAALRARGADSAAVGRAVAEGYRTGRYRAPRRAGVAYMLSSETRFFDPRTGAVERGQPHLMFYAPYLRNTDIGSPGEHGLTDPAMPFVIEEGRPNAYIVVLMGGGRAPAAPWDTAGTKSAGGR